MNQAICEREAQTAAAVHSGTIDHEIAAHARQCPVCSDILLVNEFLRENAALDQERTALPDAGLIWQKAQSRANQQAMRLALRPIRFMKIIAVVAFACSAWLRLLLPIGKELLASWSRSLDLNLGFASKIWPTMANESTILLASSGTLVLLGLSSWYMLRQE
jgi:predicted anti-sigma-YlaC factor YlaD